MFNERTVTEWIKIILRPNEIITVLGTIPRNRATRVHWLGGNHSHSGG
jgi:hypothetical protein